MAEFDKVNATFLGWLEANGATVSSSISLQDYSTEGAGRGVVAVQDIGVRFAFFPHQLPSSSFG
jgi:SET domain-containing protein 6